jgi:preprotein translocase subunit SecE
LKKKRETFTSQTMREMKKTVGPNRYAIKEALVKRAITGNYTQ